MPCRRTPNSGEALDGLALGTTRKCSFFDSARQRAKRTINSDPSSLNGETRRSR
jgi:hypothetical protein